MHAFTRTLRGVAAAALSRSVGRTAVGAALAAVTVAAARHSARRGEAVR